MSVRADISPHDAGANLLKSFTLVWLGLLWLWVGVWHFLSPASGRWAVEGSAQFLAALAYLAMLAYAGQQARALVVGARVLGPQLAPRSLWRAWLHGSLKELMGLWGITLFYVGTLLIPANGPLAWPSAVALVSGSLCLVVLWTLSAHRLLAAAWWWGLMMALLLAVSAMALTGADLVQALRHGDGLSWPVILALLGSWPMLAWVLWRQWSDAPPQARSPAKGVAINPWQILRSHVRRYTTIPVLGSFRNVDPPRPGTGSLAWQMPLNFMLLIQFAQPPVGLLYKGAFGPMQLPGMLMVISMAAGSLVCKDFHWRSLLVPGGLHFGSMGWRIAVSTITAWFATLGAITLVLMFGAWVLLGFSPDAILHVLPRFQLLPLHLVFGICVATFLSALRISLWWGLGVPVVVILGLLGWLWVLPQLGVTVDTDEWFHAGPEYVATLLALSALAVLLANRLWTVDKLMRVMARSA